MLYFKVYKVDYIGGFYNMFKLHSDYKPTGDQPQAIEYLSKGIEEGKKQGISQGEKNKAIEIAKKMKQQGIEYRIIQEVTDLDEEEIKNI